MKTIISGLLVIATACPAVTAFAQISARQYSLEIKRQPLADALIEFSKQTGLQIAYFPETSAENILIGPLSGHYTAADAITHLLLPSGLSFERLNERTIAVMESASKKSQRQRFLTTELKKDYHTEGSFMRLDHGRMDEVPVTKDAQRILTAANAQEADKNKQQRLTRGLEEVVVTAQKREEHLQDVPISISVLGGEQLDSARGAGLLEALSAAPGVTIRENAQGSTTSLSVRGVTATSPLFNGSSPIGFYVDSLPFGLVRSAAIPDVNAYDLDRVEVLRGPQGTLYGASSLNGVVRVLTNEADLNNFDLKGRTSASSTKKGGGNYRGDLAVNLPIIAGRLAARAVVGYEDRSGWVDTPNRQDVNDARVSNVRLKVKSQATDDLSIGLTAWRQRTRLGAPSISDDQDRRISDDHEPNSTEFETHSLTVNYELPIFSISSMTSYLKFSNESLLSLDAVFPGLAFFDTEISGKTISQELLLSSNAPGSWRWSAGAFYRDAEDEQFQVFAGVDNTNKSRSLALFGQLTRMFMDDRLEVSAGLRYFEDEVSNQNNPGPIYTAPPFYKVSNKFDELSPKATITWHPNTDSTIYASYGEGFRSGFSQNSNVARLAPNFSPVEPDNLSNYEIGAKTSLVDGRLDFETAVFYIDWRDTQQVLTVQDDDSPAGFVAGLNVGKVDGFGVDVSLTARPYPALELAVSYNWNDLAFRTPVVSGGAILFGKGVRPNSSAEETVGGSVRYSLAMRNGWYSHFDASANYTSSLAALMLVGGVPVSRSGQPVLMVRSGLSLEAPEHWTITAFVDNLTNTRHFTARNGPDEWTARVRPRTIGLQLEYSF